MTVVLIVVAATLTISAICSLLEATLFSTRVTALEAAKTRGRHQRTATILYEMKKDVTRPTAAILILNTIANTAGATVAGTLAAREFGGHYVPLFSAVFTLAILLLAEIVPKTYGAVHWRILWPYIVWPLVGIQKVLRPMVWMTQHFASMLVPSQPVSTTTQDEVLAMIRLSAKGGELSATELELLTAVFHFDDVICRQVMVPRNQVVFLQNDSTLEQCLEVVRTSGHTRYPLREGGPEAPSLLVHVKDLLGMELSHKIHSVARPAHLVPETMPIPNLLRDMQKTHHHMAIVVDEHGAMVGVVTLENIIEQIVGAVQDEFDDEEPDIVKEAERNYVVRGSVPIPRVNRKLNISLPISSDIDTLSGLLVLHRGELLKVGDQESFAGIEAEVLQVVGNRATKIRIVIPEVVADSE